MAAATHETVREREIAEARKKLEDLHATREDIDTQIKAQELIVQAWTNFELTLQGKFQAPTPTPRKPRTESRAPRGAGGEMQKRILAVIQEYGDDGAKAESINAELNATDVEEKKIAAALFRMKKAGVLNQAGRRQPYTLGANAPSPVPSQAS